MVALTAIVVRLAVANRSNKGTNAIHEARAIDSDNLLIFTVSPVLFSDCSSDYAKNIKTHLYSISRNTGAKEHMSFLTLNKVFNFPAS